MTDVVLTENELGKESVGGNNVAVISAGVDNVQISKSETARVNKHHVTPLAAHRCFYTTVHCTMHIILITRLCGASHFVLIAAH